ncbi:preprotein translocase subunit SecY [Neisseria sp. WLZKY-1]|uniref:preprotein translocase subunit SecY n=1 Tax=Neisseria sp. WLZKY-1 TaxID=3390377 RepID=UPI00397DC1FB
MANRQLILRLFRSVELKNRLLFLLAALIVFRIGAHIPVPGVDTSALAEIYKGQSSGILGMLNIFSGGSLERFSIFAIGIMPYISASIIVQLASEIIPSLKALKKEGDIGRKQITKYTRFSAVILAIFQGFVAATFVFQQGVIVIPQVEFYFLALICLVTGTMFLMWLGEQITERGIGNGISLIITAGICAGIPSGIVQLWSMTVSGKLLSVLFILFSAIVLIYIVVFFESALRKIPIHYARRQILGGGQGAHLPFKLNMAGVIPPIFASSVILFPVTIVNWLGNSYSELQKFALSFQHGTIGYIVLFASSVIFFCYFYTALMFSPKEMAENLKKGGAFVPGIRPGAQTAFYLESVVTRLTLWGAIYITIVCLIPELFISFFNISFALGGTSLLILVVVTMDFNIQISSYGMVQQYESLMSRTNRLN